MSYHRAFGSPWFDDNRMASLPPRHPANLHQPAVGTRQLDSGRLPAPRPYNDRPSLGAVNPELPLDAVGNAPGDAATYAPVAMGDAIGGLS